VSGSGWDQSVGPDGAPAGGSGKQAWFDRAAPGYFKTMGTGLLAGREFNDHDTLGSAKVAIVNEEFAREYFAGANPVGHSFHIDASAGQPEPLFQVVGLVRNTKYQEVKEDVKAIGFFPIAQDEHPGSSANFVLRIAGAPGPIIAQAKSVVAGMSPAIGIQFRTISEQLDDSIRSDRAMAILSGGFGLLATLLATLGLYGVISYMVARRRKEIGVRMALGADNRRIVRLVLKEALLLVVVGLVTGIVVSLWAAQLAGALLYGVEPRDVPSLVAASVLLTIVALVASYIPARRAAAADPMTALRVQ
jgi:predicted permease